MLIKLYLFHISNIMFAESISPQPIFELLADGLSNNGYAIADHVFSLHDVLDILEEMRMQEHAFKKSGIGQANDYTVLHTRRGDYIKWLSMDTAPVVTKRYLHFVHELRQFLNRFCFLGLQDLEAHFTKYPIGTRYVRHVDAFSKDDNRSISVVFYINPSWKNGDGGELILYPNNKNTPVEIAPIAGRLAVFESTIEHEVLPSLIERHSITGWMLHEKRFF